MTDAALLTTTRPHIETMSVNVQVIRIGTRQMTQAVFRQLPYRDWLTRFPGIRQGAFSPALETAASSGGLLWGYVRYFWEGCCLFTGSTWKSSNHPYCHWHVVWETDGTLWRAGVPRHWEGKISYDTPHREALAICWQHIIAQIEQSGQLFIAA